MRGNSEVWGGVWCGVCGVGSGRAGVWPVEEERLWLAGVLALAVC